MYHQLLSRQTSDNFGEDNITSTIRDILDRIEQLKNVGIALLVLSLVSVALRFYVRIGMSRTFAKEDWAMVAASLFATTQFALCLVSVDVSNKVLGGTITPALLNLLNATNRGIGIFYILTLIATKISLGYFFLNIFSHRKIQRIIIYVTMGLATISGVIYIPLGYGFCANVKPPPGLANTCFIQDAATAFLGIFSVVHFLGDFVLAGMAIAALTIVRLPVATRVSAGLLIILGSAGGVATVVRLAYTWKPTNPANFTSESLLVTMLQQIELATGIIAVNLAMIRPLFHKFMVFVGAISSTSQTNSKPVVTGNTGAHTQRSANHRSVPNTHHDSNGEELLLDEIKRDMTVTVEIRANQKTDPFNNA